MVSSSYHLSVAVIAATLFSFAYIASAEEDFDMIAKIQHMRGNDRSLIMADGIKPEMEAIRDGEFSACNSGLPQVLSFLTSADSDANKKGQAAALVSLCSNSHPVNRAKIGSSEGVVSSLVDLIRVGTEKWKAGEDIQGTYKHLDTAGLAAEAIRALSENSAENHKAFVEAGAINELGGFIVASKGGEDGKVCSFPGQSNNGPIGRTPCNFFRMWAAAALETLSNDYCEKENWPCLYDWDDDEKTLTIHDDETVTIDASAERESIANIDGLLEELISIVCSIDPARGHMREHPLPTESMVGRDDGAPSTVAWAAAGVLKNLALLDTVRPSIAADGPYNCLCKMADGSDWLESDIAEDVLHHSGRLDDCDAYLDDLGDDDYDEEVHGGEL
mmetsp:Transcript_20854/g.30716  ORF Transcript_20854/g.30716 Transcript_20854/m.30716 type:complete len:389 (+) Transcript_20854:77-1243(+)